MKIKKLIKNYWNICIKIKNASVKIGAVLAKAPEESIQKLETYSNNIGLAFQIKDDILSETGNPMQLGKPIGNDRKSKKSTYVTIYGLQYSQKLLEELIDQAIDTLKEFHHAEFLKDLAIYIKEREK